MTIDWDDPAVRAIIDCPDGIAAWHLLLGHLAPLKAKRRREVRDAIWSRRREMMLKRKALRLLADAAKGSFDAGIPVCP
jgi:hypothetical protein